MQQERREAEGQGDHTQLRMQRQQTPPNRQCPRCNSNNTKFCYYNNYSVSQPRYLCKACRRHWTHGGTLRHVPIGGSSRHCKRSRNSNSGENLNLSSQSQPCMISIAPPFTSVEAGGALTAVQSRMSQPQGFNNIMPNLNFGYDDIGGGSSSNLGLLNEFNIPHIQHGQLYHMGNVAKSFGSIQAAWNDKEVVTSQFDWRRCFINSAHSSSALSINSTTITGTNCNSKANGSTTSGFSSCERVGADQWPDVLGFGLQ